MNSPLKRVRNPGGQGFESFSVRRFCWSPSGDRTNTNYDRYDPGGDSGR
jgi:hypothetical protein